MHTSTVESTVEATVASNVITGERRNCGTHPMDTASMLHTCVTTFCEGGSFSIVDWTLEDN